MNGSASFDVRLVMSQNAFVRRRKRVLPYDRLSFLVHSARILFQIVTNMPHTSPGRTFCQKRPKVEKWRRGGNSEESFHSIKRFLNSWGTVIGSRLSVSERSNSISCSLGQKQ